MKSVKLEDIKSNDPIKERRKNNIFKLLENEENIDRLKKILESY